MPLPRFLTHAVGDVVGAVGAAQNLLPGKGTSSATKVANAIVDPNVVMSNPSGIFTKSPAFTPVQPASGGQAAGAGGAQAGTDINTGGSNVNSGFDQSGANSDTAAKAQHVANLTQLRGDIAGFIQDLTGKYHTIMDMIDGATQDAADQTGKTYAQQEGDTTDSFNKQVPGLNFGYYANGIGDSSYRGEALDNAASALKGSINTIEANKTADLQKIQQTAESKKAGYGADLGNLGSVQDAANMDDSESNLQGTRSDLMTRGAAVAADMPNFKTGAQFSQDLKASAPTKDLTPIVDALTKVVQGQAATPIKHQVANQILSTSNISEADKQKLKDKFGIA